MGIHAEGLAVLRDGIVEPAYFQQELTVGIVGIRVVGNQFNVFLKGLLRVLIVSLLTEGIAENVVGGRVVGSKFCGSLEVSDRLLVFLLTEIIIAETEARSLVVRISGNEFIETLFLLDYVAIGAGFIGKNE